VGKVTILYQGRKIHIFTDMIRHKLKLIVNGEHIEDFSDVSSWARIRETATKHLKIHLTDVQVDVSVYYPSLGTSIKAPSQKYGGKLEGLCGDCDHNPYDDLRTPSGAIINDTDEFALSWLYDKLPGGQSKEMCANKPEDCSPLPKKSDPCNLILDYKTFGQCLRVLDPSLFLEWCKKDTCGNHPELACTAIEAYARDCSNTGFCINWRTNVCPKTCPPDKIYNPCGTSCPKTCQSIKEKEEKNCPKIPVEGCFCPEGQVQSKKDCQLVLCFITNLQLLRNDTCVVEKDCEVCDEEGHHPGDTWKKDKCTSCTCEGTSQKCETERCSGADKICEQGYQVMKVPSGEKECCDKYACGKFLGVCSKYTTDEKLQYLNQLPGQLAKLLKLLLVDLDK
jgi:von Willebrand factor